MNFNGAQELGVFILIIIALLPAIKTIIVWSRGSRTEILPQPLSVRPAMVFPTKAECELQHAAQDHRITALENSTESIRNTFSTALSIAEDHHTARTHELRKELKEDYEKVHSRIGVVLVAVTRIEGKLSNHPNLNGDT